jgi:hypothetical protein
MLLYTWFSNHITWFSNHIYDISTKKEATHYIFYIYKLLLGLFTIVMLER